MDFFATARRQMLAGQLHDAREQLEESIFGLSEEEMLEPGASGAWSVRDVLAHLSAWDRETTEMYRGMLRGERPPLLDLDEEGIQQFNAEHHELLKDVSVGDALAEFHAAREEMVEFLRGVDNATMFAPAPGDEHADLAIAACIQVSIDHDQEHAAMIEEWRENRTPGTST